MRHIFLSLLFLSIATALSAQSANRQARVPLNVYVVSYQGQAGNPTASITLNGETVTTSGNGAQSPVLDTTLDVSQTYTLSSALSQSYYAKVHIESPGREWVVYVDGEPMNGPIYAFAGALSHEIAVLPRRQLRGPAGLDSGLRLGSVHWELSAGLLPSGKSAGNIFLKSEDVHANLHKPQSLSFVNLYPSEVSVFNDGSGNLRYIQTPGNLISIWFSSSWNSTFIDFYKDGQFSRGTPGTNNPSVNSGATHFVRYRIHNPPDGDLYIEQQVFGTATVGKRYHVDKSGST
ncbi:MAG: hypothetical protein HRU10_14890 [Opitutales bacterium]|nr:hypothetical protein [Opitutales bacterium]